MATTQQQLASARQLLTAGDYRGSSLAYLNAIASMPQRVQVVAPLV